MGHAGEFVSFYLGIGPDHPLRRRKPKACVAESVKSSRLPKGNCSISARTRSSAQLMFGAYISPCANIGCTASARATLSPLGGIKCTAMPSVA